METGFIFGRNLLFRILLVGACSQLAESAVTFTSLPDTTSQAESIAVGTTVYTVAPASGAAPYNCSVTLQNPDDANRKFSFSGLQLETIATLDFETYAQYVVTVQCSDSAAALANSSLTVNIQDVNDEKPVISGALSANLNEEETIGTPVANLFNATDADAGDVLSYALTGSDTGYFQVDSSSGTVSVKTRLDRDGPSARVVFNQLTLVVTDSVGATATASLTITLDDINDNTPSFSPNVYYVTVAENSASGSSLVTITCDDPDETPGNGDITYAIFSGDDTSARFTLSGTELQTTSNAIDYEALSGQNYAYRLIITGTDGGTPANIGSATVMVQVSSENDNSPSWGTFNPPYVVGQSYEVAENASAGTGVVTVAATDLDHGVDGTITYSIISIVGDGSSQPGVFRIDSVSGEVQTNVLLERDPPSGISEFNLDIRGTDSGSPAGQVSRTITIKVLDSNDNPPSFTQSLYSVVINENQATTTSVLTLTSTDSDPSSGSPSYSIVGGNTDSKFSIQSGDELQIQTVIDLDSPNNDGVQYTLVIEAVDGGTPELTGTTTVIVTIAPINEFPPAIQAGSHNVSVGEDSVVGATMSTVTATDDDAGTHGDITYSISSGDSGNNFYINSASGQIKLIKGMDFDSLLANPIKLTVLATDGGGLSGSVTVTVHVTDVNDNSPSCSSSILHTSIDETASVGSNVQTVSCTDLDSSDTLTYSIVSGNTGSVFNILLTGQFQLQNAVDYESGVTSYSVLIEASDGLNTAEVRVVVDINPINENTPSFSPVEQNVTAVAEDTALSTTLVTFTASDTDTGKDGELTYTIVSVTQSGSSKFGIDAVSGDVLLVNELDYESLSSSAKYYVVVIRATDGGGLQGIGTLSVHVSDVNDHSPSCSQTYITVSQAENTPPGSLPLTLLASLACSDLDDGSFGTLRYGMSQSPSGSEFAIDSGTGVVTLTGALDFETTSSFTLTVTVDDGATPSKSTTLTVKVTVINANDGGPSFSGSFNTDVAESASVGQSVLDVTASDPDAINTPEGNLIYSIISGDASNQFAIESSTGRLTVNKRLDRETVSSYSIVIQAIEEAGTNSVTTVVNVNVTNINDNTPVCPNSVITTSVIETAVISDVIQTLGCTDDDGDTVSYSITSGDVSIFQISTNDLTLKNTVDFDVGTRSYDLIISASDGTNTQDIQVTVNIDPVNEGTPTFSNSGTYSVDVGEDESVGNSILTVTAADIDSADTSHGQVRYSFVAQYPKFLINVGNGVITLQSSLDREAVDTYTLLITGNDGSLSSTATVVVNVTDANDNDPIFNAYSYSGTVSEADAGGSSVIVTVSATDADDPNTSNNGVVTYSIAGGNTGGVFSLAANGDIRSTASIDYEALSDPSFSLTVYAVDRSGAAGALTSTVVVIISITSVNDNDPIFSSISFNASLSEAASLGSVVSHVTATDSDLGDDGEIFYTMSSQTKFLLDSSTGQITLRDYLDYETEQSYTFGVIAKDRGSPSRSTTVTVYVSITDVNDNIPECTPSTDSVLLREDTSTGSTIVTLTCSDLDDGGSSLLTYSILSVNSVVGNGLFQAMSSNALVSTSAFDYESTASYYILIRVIDGGSPALSSTVAISVSISDVNEYDPNFNSLPYSTNIPENTATGTSVYTVAANNGDSSETVRFSLNPTSPIFSVDPLTGVISVVGPTDRESADFYNLTLVATDSGTIDSTRTVTTSVEITITDVNDNTPIFNPGSYANSLSESTLVGTTIVSLTVTDADFGSNGDVTYNILSGNTNNVFRVDKHIPTGECKLIVDNVAFLDYETSDSYSLVIRATDGGGLTSDANMYLTVTAVNEFTPTFTPSSSSSVYVTEDSTIDTFVIDLNATDSDLGIDGEIVFSIKSGAFGKFSVDPQSGVVVVSGSLDAENTLVYNLAMIAVDRGTNPSAKTATYSLTVHVTDINDVSPVCSRSLYSSSLSESTSSVTSVSQLSCSDGDNDNPNNQLTYSIIGGPGSSLFQIDVLGEVSAIGTGFDYEVNTSYSLTIRVSDQGSPTLSTSVTLDVNIADENDNDPAFCCSPYLTSVGEEVDVDSLVLQLVATDADDNIYGSVVYSISTGNSAGKFTIDRSTGEIRTASVLDYESTKAYNLTILASDLGSPARSGSATVSVDIVDYNDNLPVCTPVYYRSVAENASVSHSVVTVACSDADERSNTLLAYSLLSTSVPFQVGGSTGEIVVSTPMDAESQALYALDVMVSDGIFTYNVSVIVTITDVNEAAPSFSPAGPYSVFVKEDETIGNIVEMINATDTDVSETTFYYVISSGNPDSNFQIHPSSGIVRISSALDYETNALYEIEIIVSDGIDPSSLSSTTSLTISVLDVNDNAPVCSPDNYFHTVLENVTGTLLTLTCSDVDSVSTTLTYTITSGNANGDLSIGTNSGDISVSSALDYETTPSYDLVVEVTDGVLTTSAVVIISVDGVNEYDPAFTAVNYATTLSEDSQIGTSVIVVNATDNDSGYDGILRYSISAGNSENKFSIQASTGRIKVSGLLNREKTSEHILTVRVTDNLPGYVDERSADISVNITITDVNDNFPVFNPVSYFIKSAETAAPGSTLVYVTASDDDVGMNGNLNYSITSGNAGAIFTMTANAIEIAGGKNLDYETATFHTLTVQATDQGGVPKIASAIVSIQVLPVNEFTPEFSSNGSVTIPEDTAVGTVIVTALAADSDMGTDGTIIYAIISGNSPGTPFYINSLTGQVLVWSQLDFDVAPHTYSLEIEAKDRSGNITGLSSTVTMSVILTDVNDETPVFSSNSYYFTLEENVAELTPVGTVIATDADIGVNGNVTFLAVTGDTNVFSVNAVSGEIQTASTASIDFETKTQYSLVIQAIDSGSPQRSSQSTVFITVTDLNDNKPIFQLANFTISIYENASISTLVTTVVASDSDTGSNGVFTYSLLAGSPFAVHSTNGAITTTGTLDRETNPSYTLVIKALDQGSPAKTGTSSVSVVILDINDNPPVVSGVYDTTIPEDIAADTVVLTITANDLDAGSNADLLYSILSGDTNNDWKIETEVGIVQNLKTLDRETTADYHLVVVVSDKGSPVQSTSVTLSLTVSDVNDNSPVFSLSPYAFNIAENVATGSAVGRLTAADADTGVNSAVQFKLVYLLVGANVFDVDISSGEITTTGSLDREMTDRYVLVCRANDNGSPQLSAEVQVTVTVTDLNDNNPVFSATEYRSIVTENTAAGTSVLTVLLRDNDIGTNAAVALSIDTSTTDGLRAEQLFALNSSTGIISVKQVIDRETDSSFVFTLYGKDGGSPSLNDSTSISISVFDENDNAPIFTTSFLNKEVAFDGTCTSTITAVTAVDIDEGSNALVNYYIVQTGSNHLFSVGETTGEVGLKATAVAGTKYLIYVMAQDRGTTTRTSANNLAIRIDAFDPASNAISFTLSVSKAYFTANENSFVSGLTFVYNNKYPSVVVKTWCVEQRDGQATDPSSGRRRLLATGDKPVTVHVYVLSDNTTNSVSSVGVAKNFLSSQEALSFVADGSSPSAAITGSAWSDYGIVTVTEYKVAEEDTPWIQTATGIAVVTSSVVAFILLILLIGCLVYCCQKRRKRPITPVRPVTSDIVGTEDEKNNISKVPLKSVSPMPTRGLQDLKKSLRPAILALPMPERRKAVNNDILIVNPPRSADPILTREFDGMAVDPASGKLYEYNTRTKERRWLSTPKGKAVTANNLTDQPGSQYGNYNDV